MMFDDEFLHFFDEPERLVSSEAKESDNEGDELLKMLMM